MEQALFKRSCCTLVSASLGIMRYRSREGPWRQSSYRPGSQRQAGAQRGEGACPRTHSLSELGAETSHCPSGSCPHPATSSVQGYKTAEGLSVHLLPGTNSQPLLHLGMVWPYSFGLDVNSLSFQKGFLKDKAHSVPPSPSCCL